MVAKAKKPADHESRRETKKMEKEPLPILKPGMTVKVHQKITEIGPKGAKDRVQIFEGIILGHRGGGMTQATITVRKVSDGIGVEKIFPLYSPNVLKIEPIKQAQVRQAKLGYLRTSKKRLKEVRLKTA